MTAAEIIKALGGTRLVADELGAELNAVSNWRKRGIPQSRGLDVAEMAKRLGKPAITPAIIRSACVKQDAPTPEPMRAVG